MTEGQSLVRLEHVRMSFQRDSAVLLGKVFKWDVSYQWVVLKAILFWRKLTFIQGLVLEETNENGLIFFSFLNSF